jgi:hypothetical protein
MSQARNQPESKLQAELMPPAFALQDCYVLGFDIMQVSRWISRFRGNLLSLSSGSVLKVEAAGFSKGRNLDTVVRTSSLTSSNNIKRSKLMCSKEKRVS